MGKRINVLISDEAYTKLLKYQNKNNLVNKDSTIEHLIMNYGEQKN